MIVVTEIKTLEVPDDWRHEVKHFNDNIECISDGCLVPHSINYVSEIVTGRRFINPRTNFDMIIGYTTEAEKILGITYESFDNSEQRRKEAENKLFIVEKELDTMKKNKKKADWNYYLRYNKFPD